MKRLSTRRFAFALAAVVFVGACERGPEETPPAKASPAAQTPAQPPSLDVAALRNATYRGLQLVPGAITLADGVWEGPPHVEGGASRTRVTFARDFRLLGDLDGDGADEAVVILDESGGGSGTFASLAVVARRASELLNVATAPLGDRVQIRSGRIETGTLDLDLVQAGPQDAACCPGELVRRRWLLVELPTKSILGPFWALEESGSAVPQGRLGVETLAGVEWVLRHWTWELPAPAEPEVTLRYADGRFAGSAGCNRYFAPVQAGGQPGDVTLGRAGSTRMLCADTAMAVEGRFLAQLGGVQKFGFMLGYLALTYEKDGAVGVMLFDSRPFPQE